jgi:hypothetical protein
MAFPKEQAAKHLLFLIDEKSNSRMLLIRIRQLEKISQRIIDINKVTSIILKPHCNRFLFVFNNLNIGNKIKRNNNNTSTQQKSKTK